jgi:hypothetical protein
MDWYRQAVSCSLVRSSECGASLIVIFAQCFTGTLRHTPELLRMIVQPESRSGSAFACVLFGHADGTVGVQAQA